MREGLARPSSTLGAFSEQAAASGVAARVAGPDRAAALPGPPREGHARAARACDAARDRPGSRRPREGLRRAGDGQDAAGLPAGSRAPGAGPRRRRAARGVAARRSTPRRASSSSTSSSPASRRASFRTRRRGGEDEDDAAAPDIGLEEERRLFYVALTRAKRGLSISYSKARVRWGQEMPTTPSRFLAEMGTEGVVVQDGTQHASRLRPEFRKRALEELAARFPRREAAR